MRTSHEWHEYYKINAQSLLDIPWQDGGDLSPEERAAIERSVQEFQAGESSEGRNLYRNAKAYSEKMSDPDYAAAIRLFIAEEQRHARDLARFLQLNGIATLKTTFPDRVFRGLRHLVDSLELSIAVLVTAEIFAKVYYAALEEATSSVVLRQLCKQILQDEERHVEFQVEQLGKLRYQRAPILNALAIVAQKSLFFGACIVVWTCHKRVFHRGGYNFMRFWTSSWREFRAALKIADDTAAALRSAPISSEKGTRTPARDAN